MEIWEASRAHLKVTADMRSPVIRILGHILEVYRDSESEHTPHSHRAHTASVSLLSARRHIDLGMLAASEAEYRRVG